MKALVLDLKNNKPIVEMRDMPVPKILPNEVLVKVKAASICGTDISVAEYVPAMRKRIKKFPHILGHEFAGEVVELGAKVDRDWLHIGDCVSAETHIYCGKCPICLNELNLKHVCPNLKLLGVDRNGCFAEFIAIPERVLWKNNDSSPYYLASIQEPLGNAVYCITDGGGVKNKTVLIIGDGPAALFATATARIFGASRIVVLGHHKERLDIAGKVGADRIINNIFSPEKLKSRLALKNFDVVLEYSGSNEGINLAIDLVGFGGRLAAFGLTKEVEQMILYNKLALKIVNLRGIYGRIIWDTWKAVDWILRKYPDVIKNIITHRLHFYDFQHGFDLMMRTKNCGKIVLYI